MILLARIPLGRATLALGVVLLAVLVVVGCEVAEAASAGQGRGRMARGAVAEGADAFTTSATCARCHSRSPRARALTTATGEDASPFETWRGTLMANAFLDPYWRAQMASEIERSPERKAAIEGLCLTCHAPMESHAARLAGRATPAFEDLLASPLARDGVSCTVCHQAPPDALGSAASFSGNLGIRDEKTIYGPFPDPVPGPMRMHTGYTPTHGPHVSSSALCGSCHTLYTTPAEGAAPFLEQASYLEWRNSEFSTEDGRPGGTSCQECHMPDAGRMKIARNPAGFDFAIEVRDGVRGHAFVGGNAVMLDMLRENAEALGVSAPAATLQRLADATRAQLAHRTADLDVEALARDGDELTFDVRVTNLTGHKFPSGYPARRAWLNVQVREGREILFESGAFDEEGRLVGFASEVGLPHHDVVGAPDQVVVYEMVAADLRGRPTTALDAMAARVKDTRLLPAGWSADGPHADETAPLGVDGDDDFAAGGDVVSFRVPLSEHAGARLVVVARIYYQPIPPHWVDALRGSETEAAAWFVEAYERLAPAPETVAIATAVAEPR